MRPDDLEVVWPLHRSHYLSPMLTDEDLAMHPDFVSADDAPPPAPDATTPGRELAVRALLAGADCQQQRVSELLDVSRWTIDRMADDDLSIALRDAQVLEGARTCLAETAGRGSTVGKREAALAWLQQAARDEHQVAGVQALRRRPPGPRPGRGIAPTATAALAGMAPRHPRLPRTRPRRSRRSRRSGVSSSAFCIAAHSSTTC